LAYEGIITHPGWAGAYPLIGALTNDYREVWTTAAAEAFYGGVQKWCHDHGVLSVGHQGLDNNTETLCSASGDFFKNSVYNDHPGIDVIWDHVELGRLGDFPRYAGACKRLYGKERAISETFAEMGLAQYPDRMRFVMEQQIVRGVDEFVIMVSEVEPIEPKGLDLLCFSPGDAMVERFGPLVHTHVCRAADISNAGIPGGTTALYLPLADIHMYQHAKRDGHVNNYKMPRAGVDAVARELAYLPCDFDYIWEDALTVLPIADGAFIDPSGGRIDTVILPPRAMVEAKALERLKDFARAGGRVVMVEVPVADEGLFTLVDRVESLRGVINSPVRATGGGMIALRHRRTEDGCSIYMLLNESDKPAEAHLCFEGTESLCEVDLLSGELHTVSLGNNSLMFGAGGLRVFVAGTAGIFGPVTLLPEYTITKELTDITLTLPDGREAKTGGGSLPLWAELGYADYSGEMTYTARFALPEGRHDALLSLGDVKYSAGVSLDGGTGVLLPFYPFEAEFSGLEGGDHTISITVYNTRANSLLGTREREREVFGSYTPHFLHADRKYLPSGLSGPVKLAYRSVK